MGAGRHTPSPTSLRWFWWRGLVFVLSFVLGFTAFALGVGVSDRPGVGDADLMAKVYYSLGLFVFGGLDLGVPQGGPAAARTLLWIAYFTSPAITAAAVIEGAIRVLRPERWGLRRMHDHVVIGGGGELARMVLQELRAVDPERRVVVVEVSPDAPFLEEARHGHDALVLVGDITSPTILSEVRAAHAHRVLLLTGDDLANVEAAHVLSEQARAERPLDGRLVVHVSDLRLMRDLAESVPWRDGLFNSHHIAARHVVDELLLPHFAATEAVDEVILAGFGRFGQSLLAELQERAADQLQRVLVIDLEAEKNLRIFREEVGLAERCAVTALDGDMRDPAVWAALERDRPQHPVFVLGAVDEGANLHVALRLARVYPDAKILVRTVRRSTFVEQMARRHGFVAARIPEHIRGSMRANRAFGLARAEAARPAG